MGLKAVILVGFLAYMSYYIFKLLLIAKYNDAIFSHKPGRCNAINIQEKFCKNKHNDDGVCDEWAQRGECTANENWMKEHCAKACSHCEDKTNPLLGSADVANLKGGKFLISSGLSCFGKEVYNQTKGFYLFDFGKPTQGAQPVTIIMNETELNSINPHAISSFVSDSGKVYVFVVNKMDRVEKFEYFAQNNTLLHLETFQDVYFNLLWSIEATGDNSFFASSLGYFHNKALACMERYLMLRLGYIIYYDGNESKAVASRLFNLDGMAMSSDNKLLYVANGGEQSLETYNINGDFDLKKVGSLELNTMVAKIKLDSASGDLIVATIPSPGNTIDYIMGKQEKEYAPSKVLRIKVEKGIPKDSIEELYSSNGYTLKAISVASVFQKHVFIGTLFDKTISCEMLHE